MQSCTAGLQVRYVGVSNETSYGIGEFVHAAKQHGLPKIVSVQNSYSLMFRGAYEQDMAEACAPHHHNVGLLAYSPLAGGALTGKYRDGGYAKSRFNVFPGELCNPYIGHSAPACGCLTCGADLASDVHDGNLFSSYLSYCPICCRLYGAIQQNAFQVRRA